MKALENYNNICLRKCTSHEWKYDGIFLGEKYSGVGETVQKKVINNFKMLMFFEMEQEMSKYN